MKLDIEALREEVKSHGYAMVYGAGIPAGLADVAEAELASPEKLVKMAEDLGIDLEDFFEDD